MQTVCEINMCSGCGACIEVCPKAAIHILDTLSDYNAVINEELCINCGACYKVCQNNRELSFYQSNQWLEGWSDTKREGSSSGGVAAEIVKSFINQGGTVCSCAFLNGKFGFYFSPGEIEPELYAGSKYVKSNPVGIYRKLRKYLAEGKKVLFIGLPCQVAAVKCFVGNELEKNLFTIDLICHGSPSPIMLDLFLKDYGLSLSDISSISFRKKMKYRVLPNQKYLEPMRVMDAYTYAFLSGLSNTENCYRCHYAKRERVSDLTIGDSWGSSQELEERIKGISLILCQTEKGKQLIENSCLHLQSADCEKAYESNHQLTHPSEKPSKRDEFYNMIYGGKSFKKSVEACFPVYCIKERIKRILIKLRILSDR